MRAVFDSLLIYIMKFLIVNPCRINFFDSLLIYIMKFLTVNPYRINFFNPIYYNYLNVSHCGSQRGGDMDTTNFVRFVFALFISWNKIIRKIQQKYSGIHAPRFLGVGYANDVSMPGIFIYIYKQIILYQRSTHSHTYIYSKISLTGTPEQHKPLFNGHFFLSPKQISFVKFLPLNSGHLRIADKFGAPAVLVIPMFYSIYRMNKNYVCTPSRKHLLKNI